MKVYKIVRQANGKLWSAWAPYAGAVEYIPGRWATPRRDNGPLTAYKDFDEAMFQITQLLPPWFDYCIFEAEAEPWDQKLPRNPGGVIYAWVWDRGVRYESCLTPFSSRSLALCRRIKLLRCLWDTKINLQWATAVNG